MTALTSSFFVKQARTRYGSWLPFTHSVHEAKSFTASGSVNVGSVVMAFAPDVVLFDRCGIRATAPLRLNVLAANNAYGSNPEKWARFGGGGAADPITAFSSSYVLGSTGSDSINVQAIEQVKSGWLETLRATGANRSTFALGSGNDSFKLTSRIDASAWSNFRYPDFGGCFGLKSSSVDMGSGDDTFTLQAITKGISGGAVHALDRSHVSLGTGDDVASVTTSSNDDGYVDQFAMYHATLDAGAGDDVVTVGATKNSIVSLGSGDDELIHYSLNGAKQHTMQGGFKAGDGFDTLSLEGIDITAENFAKQFAFQNAGDTSAAFKLDGGYFYGFEQIEVAGGTFDTAQQAFI